MTTQTPSKPLICITLLIVLSNFSSGSLAQNRMPTADGPIPVSATSHPFGAADHTLKPQNLSEYSYVEEEFLLSGSANVYDWPDRDTLTVQSADAPYTTRVLIRRPAHLEDFSGNVIVEMLNPSNLFDLNIGWAISHEQMLRNGDAWVGITAKPIAVETLKQFDPDRYAALSWANPLSENDPANCDAGRGDTTKATENGLVWDMHTQLALWLRSDSVSNPFRYGDSVSAAEQLYGWGYSQTGSFLYTYVNAFHNRVSSEYGKPLFDGYIVAVSGGPTSINQCAERIDREDPRRPFIDIGVPVIHIMSQSDYLNAIPSRQPDSDSAPQLFRQYEIAGSGHASPDELYWGPSPQDLVQAGRSVPPLACNEGPRSRYPNSLAFNSILVNLDNWARNGVAPPSANLIEVVDGTPLLDLHGNVVGGYPSPYLAVPTSTWNGNSTGESFCRIAGHEIPFSTEALNDLYGNHENYVDAVKDSVAKLVTEGFLVKEDGDKVIAEAERKTFAELSVVPMP
jgi:hypothetical protein